jgi:hypothetical protein
VSRRIGHPPAASGWVDSAPFAAEGNDAVPPAGIAVNPRKAMRQNAALKKLARLAFDKPGHRTLPPALAGKESLEMFGDYVVENAVGRIARGVIRGRITNGRSNTQPRPAVISASRPRQTLRYLGSMCAHHGRCRFPGLWEASFDLIAVV